MGNACHGSKSKYTLTFFKMESLKKIIIKTFFIEKQKEVLHSHSVQRKSDFSNLNDFKIDPSLFVSLKKGAISSFYKIGEVLGEGKKINFDNKKKLH